TSQPQDIEFCAGGSGSASVTYSGAVTTYKWEMKIGPDAWFNIGNSSIPSGSFAGATTSEITLSGFTSAIPNIRCVITTADCTVNSDEVTVNILPKPTVTVNSPSACTGESAQITATPGSGQVGDYSFAWTVPATT